jgi:hypothetical protein
MHRHAPAGREHQVSARTRRGAGAALDGELAIAIAPAARYSPCSAGRRPVPRNFPRSGYGAAPHCAECRRPSRPGYGIPDGRNRSTRPTARESRDC